MEIGREGKQEQTEGRQDGHGGSLPSGYLRERTHRVFLSSSAVTFQRGGASVLVRIDAALRQLPIYSERVET